MAIDVSQVIDLERYPIHIDGEARKQLVADVQKDVRSVGCAVMRQGFAFRPSQFQSHESIFHATATGLA